MNVAPPPGVSSTQMRPPCISINSFAIARPNPVPGVASLFRQNGSNIIWRWAAAPMSGHKGYFERAAETEIESLAAVQVRFPAVAGAHDAGELSALFMQGSERRINYAPWLADRDSLSPEAISVIEIFDDFPGKHSVSIRLRPGNLLVIDNGRMLHGRAAIAGEQRKLLRAWIGDASPQ